MTSSSSTPAITISAGTSPVPGQRDPLHGPASGARPRVGRVVQSQKDQVDRRRLRQRRPPHACTCAASTGEYHHSQLDAPPGRRGRQALPRRTSPGTNRAPCAIGRKRSRDFEDRGGLDKSRSPGCGGFSSLTPGMTRSQPMENLTPFSILLSCSFSPGHGGSHVPCVFECGHFSQLRPDRGVIAFQST